MQIIRMHPAGVCSIEPDKIFNDARGRFVEALRVGELSELLAPFLKGTTFCQTNISHSGPFALRGMHFQTRSNQWKLLHCVVGKVFQVSVDVRKDSLTYGKWWGQHLAADKAQSALVPPGFANGFMSFDQGAIIVYQTTEYYDATLDRELLWNDPDVAIKWPIGHGANLNISKKDRNAPRLSALEPWVEKPQILHQELSECGC